MDCKIERKHSASQIKYTVLCFPCHLRMELEVPQCQAVGDIPLVTSGSLAGPSFIELEVLCLFGFYAAIRNPSGLFVFYFDS